jgi:hypothetical protein
VSIPADTIPPTLVLATPLGLSQVAVTFSEPVDQATAENTSNYTLNPSGSILAAGLRADGKTVSLTTSALGNGILYTLKVNGIRDLAPMSNVIAPNSQVQFVASDSGLVAAYGFDEGAGTSLVDSSGHGQNGTISGATWSASGKNGSALSFDGVNDWVTITDSDDLDLTTGMTLEAWVRPMAANNWETVILKERMGGLAYALYGGSPSGPPASYVTRSGTSDDVGADGTFSLPLNAWSHLAATYDGATIRLYVDGSLVSSTPAAGSILQSSNPLRIGGNAVWGEYFAGLIDEVRIYDRALTQTQIQIDMNRPVEGSLAASLQGVHLFYNGSTFDGNGTAVTLSDFAAIDPTKRPLHFGETASFQNVTGSHRGITGIFIDVADLPFNGERIDVADFEFLVGNDNFPLNWANGPAPAAVTVFPGQGLNASDRVSVVFADRALVDTWLAVKLRSNADTGLAEDAEFFFGSVPGDTGEAFQGHGQYFGRDAADLQSMARNLFQRTGVGNANDVNQDGVVNAFDFQVIPNASGGGVAFNVINAITPRREVSGLAVGTAMLAPPAPLPLTSSTSGRSQAKDVVFGLLEVRKSSGTTSRILDELVCTRHSQSEPQRRGWTGASGFARQDARTENSSRNHGSFHEILLEALEESIESDLFALSL